VVRIKFASVPAVQVPLIGTLGVLITLLQVVLIWFGEPLDVVPTVQEATKVGGVGTLDVQLVMIQFGLLPLLAEHELTATLFSVVTTPGQEVVVKEFNKVSPEATQAAGINVVKGPIGLQTIPSQLLVPEAV